MNMQYNAEDFGLEYIAEIELAEADWSFDLLGVWKGPEGYYLATDSGCSCPTPFENYNGIDDLTGPLTAEQAIEEATSIWTTGYYSRYDPEAFASAMALIV